MFGLQQKSSKLNFIWKFKLRKVKKFIKTKLNNIKNSLIIKYR